MRAKFKKRGSPPQNCHLDRHLYKSTLLKNHQNLTVLTLNEVAATYKQYVKA